MSSHEHNYQYADSEVIFSEGEVYLYFACECGTVKKVLRKEIVSE